jgi:hypothetical protein
MLAVNHALTGAIIGLTISNPLVALPAAVISHIVCDALPHFGSANQSWLGSQSFKFYLLVEAGLCGLLVLLLSVTQPHNWLLAAFCAFLAAAPDFIWLRQFVSILRRTTFKPTPIERFLGVIQWFQKPIGGLVEAVWFFGAVTILWQFL